MTSPRPPYKKKLAGASRVFVQTLYYDQMRSFSTKEFEPGSFVKLRRGDNTVGIVVETGGPNRLRVYFLRRGTAIVVDKDRLEAVPTKIAKQVKTFLEREYHRLRNHQQRTIRDTDFSPEYLSVSGVPELPAMRAGPSSRA